MRITRAFNLSAIAEVTIICVSDEIVNCEIFLVEMALASQVPPKWCFGRDLSEMS